MTTETLTGRQRLIMCLLLGAQFMFALDFSIVTVALPVIGDDLDMTPAELSWIVTLFALSAAGLMLLMGRIGDYYGSQNVNGRRTKCCFRSFQGPLFFRMNSFPHSFGVSREAEIGKLNE
jgi:MFS family permease